MSKVTLVKWDCQPRADNHIWNSKDKIVYGPVCSRRYRYSLGINFFPRVKVCDLNCVYCDMERSLARFLQNDTALQQVIVPAHEMLGQIRKAFEQHRDLGTEIDYITICGNGDAPLHPEFIAIVDGLVSLRDQIFPDNPLAILTNSSVVMRNEVIPAIMRLDERVFKLDAGDQQTFLKVNRPLIKMYIEDIISRLSQLKDIKISTAVVDTPTYSNIPSLTSSYIKAIEKIQPIEIHLHNIDYPIPPENDQNVRRLSVEEMMDLGCLIADQTGIWVKVLHSPISFRERHIKVLILDDNKEFLCAIKRMLKENFETILASSIEDAMAKTDESIDIAIVDVHLDETNSKDRSGLRFIEWIRSRFSHIAVIMISGYMDMQTMQEYADRLGVIQCFVKPIVMSRLIATLRSICHPKTGLIRYE